MRALIVVGLLFLAPAAQAQELTSTTAIRWSRTFATAGDDWINDIIPLHNGRFLAVGYLNRVDGDTPSDWRALAVELDGRGQVKLQSEYGEGSGVDAFWAAGEGRDGSRVFAGFTTRIGAGGIDAWMARTSSGGQLLNEISVGEGGYDRFTDLAPARDGGWVLVGHSVATGATQRRVLVTKVDAQGHEVWRRLFEDTAGGLYVEASPDGSFVVSGGAVGDDMLVMKLDSDGRELWRRAVGAPGTSDVNHGLVVRSDGRIVAFGYSQSWGAVDNDLLAVTLSPSGEELSHSVFGGAGDDHAILARMGADDRIWVVGYTKSAGAGDWDVIVAALEGDGRFAPGVALLSGPRDDNGTAILPLVNGDLLVGGYSASLREGNADAFVMRIAAPDLTQADPRFTRRAE